LLRDYFRTADESSLTMLELTLEKMANGGIYDQLGGGFHRYSTDPFWLVPHFEKMLYDNALLADLYTDVYKITKNPFYSDISQQTLDYVLREMTSPLGGFYSAQDADSEGEEGKFFVWTTGEIDRILGVDSSNLIKTYYGVTHEGNFENRNILFKPSSDKEVADGLGISLTEMRKVLEESKHKLKSVRDNRIPPNTDTKVLTAWNGLMIKSLSKASVLFDRPDYLTAAVKNAHFILDNMNEGNRLLRTYKDGKAKLLGYLEDYGCFINGIMCLYEVTLDVYWLNMSKQLSDRMIDLFWDDAENMFYDIGYDHEELLIRPRDVGDGAMPCGGSMASYVLLRLSVFTGEDEYQYKSIMNIESVGNYMFRAPRGAGNWLASVDFILGDRVEIAIIGQLSSNHTHRLLKTVSSFYLPNMILVAQDPASVITSIAIPALEHKLVVDGQSTVYLCRGYVCEKPVTGVEELISQLESRSWMI
ncbi:thioredoxin domain-containing protein, partial [Dehalococcoidia bacterium]|nr:thioredoxin domain-containing protein [Dehalococcoidia bacterium]